MKKIIAFVIVLALLIGGYFAYPYVELYLVGRDSSLLLDESEEKELFIPTGSDMNSVAELLVNNGFINDATGFKKLAQAKNYAGKNIVPGKYIITGSMTNNDLINHLRAGNGALTVQVTFNNCRDIRDLSGKVAQYIETDSTTLYEFITSDSILNHYGFSEKKMSALFLPNTYEFYWNTSASEFVERMAEEFKAFWTPDRIAKANALNLTQSEITTLASIVYAEQSIHKDEWPTIAGLYLNRLRIGQKLQSDPTAIFALYKNDIRRVTSEHLKYDSPYNTYIYSGLPPGPINIPPGQVIDAVLNPQDHNYYYMCAKPEYSGKHNFAKDYNTHLKNARKYHKWLKENNIR